MDNWIADVEQLSNIGKDEPQIALSAFTKALCMRWSFTQRTISDISCLFQPLEDVIQEKFIPSIVGRKVSEVERRILALPVRFGGLGILNPVKTADVEYEASMKITASLKQLIYYQQQSLEHYNEDQVKELINKNKQDKGKRLTQEFEQIKSQVDDNLKRYLDLAREKGSGSWLNALPNALSKSMANQQISFPTKKASNKGTPSALYSLICSLMTSSKNYKTTPKLRWMTKT